MKKVLSLILSIGMLLTCITGFAYPDVEEGTYVSEAVNILSQLDIVNGFTDGTFKPNDTITRAQMAKMVCEMLGYDNVTSSATIFTDVAKDHWASGYINTANKLDIINGYGDGTFGPEDTVTYEQAVKMVMCALGYGPLAEQKGGYPSGYLAVGSTYDVTDNVNDSTRGNIAVLIYNALTTPLVEQASYFGQFSAFYIMDGKNGNAYKTLLTEQDIYLATGIVGETNRDRVRFTISKNSIDEEFVKNDTFRFYIGKSDIASYAYQEVTAFVKQDDYDDYIVLAVQAAKRSQTFTINSDDLDEVTVGKNYTKVEYYEDVINSLRTTSFEVDTDAPIEFNKDSSYGDTHTLEDFIGLDDVELTFVENDGDGVYDVVTATQYTSERLELVDANRDRMILGGRTVEFDFSDKNATYIFEDEKGNELTLNDFEEDDVVAYYYNHDAKDIKSATYIKVILLSNAIIEGYVESVDSYDNIVTINGNEYKDATGTLEAGDEGTFYVGITGKIVYFDGSSAISNFGYILASGDSSYVFDDTVEVKMLTTNGIETYELTEKASETFDTMYGGYNLKWNAGEIETNRFIKYKVNNSGDISRISAVSGVHSFTNSEYNADTEILAGEFVETDTVVFVLDEADDDEVYVTNYKYLIDEGKYTGAVYVENGDTKVIMITDTDSTYVNQNGFAIVTGTSVLADDVIAVNYIQNEEAGSVYFDSADVPEELGVGTVFAFNTTANNFVNKYQIIATVEDDTFVSQNTVGLGSDVEVVIGYIYNTTRKTNSRGELITFSVDGKEEGKTYVVSTSANKYTFVNRARRPIETEDFLGGDAYYRDGNEVTPVLMKLVDGVVVDIYTISARTFVD